MMLPPLLWSAAQAGAPASEAQAQAMRIATRVLHQVQPCADQVVNPGPGAERIRVTIRLHYRRDGMVAGPPVFLDHAGVDASNAAYAARIDDQLTTIFRNCPLRDMPPALYDAPGGWSDFTLRFRLPG